MFLLHSQLSDFSVHVGLKEGLSPHCLPAPEVDCNCFLLVLSSLGVGQWGGEGKVLLSCSISVSGGSCVFSSQKSGFLSDLDLAPPYSICHLLPDVKNFFFSFLLYKLQCVFTYALRATGFVARP